VKYFSLNPEVRHSTRRVSGQARLEWSRRNGGVVVFLAGLLLAANPAFSQTPTKVFAQPGAYAAVKSFRIIQEKDGPAVEILSTKPLIPSIQMLADPPRLVIDLPNTRLDLRQKRVSVQADQISTLRADQFQQDPPVARVVVDLLAPRTYTWAAAGNRLVVRLGKTPPINANKTPFQAPVVVSLTPSPQPVAAVRSAGPLAVAGSNLVSGSSITAGADTAILNLARGGEVHVCPGTTVSVTPSRDGHNVLLGVNTGALETHFLLDSSSDSVMTPDFRILLPGPGEFHLAISTDTRGNTCVRSLPGNTASAIVSELLGDRTYQVKATDQLVFHSGQLDRVDMAVPLECGCPPPRQPVLRAENKLPVIESDSSHVSASGNPRDSETPMSTVPASEAVGPGYSPASDNANDLHVQVSAPFVFRATEPPPAPVEDVQALPLDTRSLAMPVLSSPLPPSTSRKPAGVATATAHRRGFFGKLRGFFAAMFR